MKNGGGGVRHSRSRARSTKMKVAIIGFVLAIVFCTNTVFAAPIKGAGASSCGRWIEDRKKDDYFSQLNWALRFVPLSSSVLLHVLAATATQHRQGNC